MLAASHRAWALALFVAGIAAAPAGQAQSIGLVEAIGGNILPDQNYNSARGLNSLASSGKTWEVTFADLGNGLNSNVQVNAVDNGNGHYCTSDGWVSRNGVDVVADVTCFDAKGNPALGDFSLFYQARTSAPAKGAIAFLLANRPTLPSYTPAPKYNFNSTGRRNTVNRDKTGVYRAFLPGMTAIGGNPQVTAYGGSAARCEVAKWFQDQLGTTVGVYCVNSAGVAADERFSLSYTIGANGAASLGAYAWANNPSQSDYVPARRFQFNSVSALPLRAERKRLGEYSLIIPNPNHIFTPTYIGMITAYGSSGEYCNYRGLMGPLFELHIDFICFDGVGRTSDTKYTGTFFQAQ
jgi:hypothetical protein